MMAGHEHCTSWLLRAGFPSPARGSIVAGSIRFVVAVLPRRCAPWTLIASIPSSRPSPPRPRAGRRCVLLGGLGLAGLFGQTEARKKHRRRNVPRPGRGPARNARSAAPGWCKDATGRCAPQLASGCTPATCPPTACGSLPDGCGGTLSCGCPANQICLRSGVCQPCTVTCTGTPVACGTALQTALNGGGTVYVCPGRYQGGFTPRPMP